MTCKDCLHYEACENKFLPEEPCKAFSGKSEWVHLPCKVGDTVYIESEYQGVVESEVRTLFLASNSIEMIRTGYCDVPFSNFGVTVFVTREEAEKALEERSKHHE